MKIIDLSHQLHPKMTIFPDDEPPQFEQVATILEDGFNETKLTLFSHNGTHIDAPSHMINDGKTLNEFEIGSFIGNALIIDLTHKKFGSIDLEEIQKYEEILLDVEYLILKTGWSEYWGNQKYLEGYPVLTSNAAKYLTKLNLKGIGIDTISVDKSDSNSYPIHHIFLEKGILIVENLTNLSAIDNNNFIFSCMPLKFADADASPIRAFAMLK